jgi:peroxiredoxin
MNKGNLITALAAALVVAGALFFLLRSRPAHPLELGETAYDFTVSNLSGGTIHLRDYQGHAVVLNFWATWCPPCVEEAPSLERFAERMQKQGVVVIGVSVDQDAAALEKFIASYHLTYPIGRDPDQGVASRYGTFQFPETYILDRQRRVAEKLWAWDWEDPRIISFVQELSHPTSASQ